MKKKRNSALSSGLSLLSRHFLILAISTALPNIYAFLSNYSCNKGNSYFLSNRFCGVTSSVSVAVFYRKYPSKMCKRYIHRNICVTITISLHLFSWMQNKCSNQWTLKTLFHVATKIENIVGESDMTSNHKISAMTVFLGVVNILIGQGASFFWGVWLFRKNML